MNRYAKIIGMNIDNIIVSESIPKTSDHWVLCPDDITLKHTFDGIDFHPEVIPDVIEPVVPVVVSRTISKLEYMNRFNDMELAMIYTVAKSSIAVEIWLDKFKLAQDINLDDQRTIDGLSAMVSGGLLTEPRMMEILK